MLDTLGQYKILERIGVGGMGDVYRARDTRLGRTVAIKVLPSDLAGNPERRGRLVREAQAAAALSHPNIAALYEIGEDQGHSFLVFEFVPGDTLTTIIAGRPLNARRAIDLAIQIADALADAHAAGMVHRDIRSGTIIVTPRGAAKILDFGLAAWTGGGVERERAPHETSQPGTSAGTMRGTVAYLSPEQVLGGQVDERTDIFSLGVVLFEMLTGRLPFSGKTPAAIALQIAQSPAPSAINPSLPRELDAIVLKALAQSLEARYESAATLGGELRSIAAILDVRTETTEAVRAGPPVPRRRGAWVAAAAVLAAMAAAAWWQRASVARVWNRETGRGPAPNIAVLPLGLAGADASRAFFADGLTDDLITRLGQTKGLRVLGRSATRAYRDRTPRDVAKELGAAVVLTGTVGTRSDQVRLTLELVDPRDTTAIWAGEYTRDVKDIFAVQAQAAEDVARALRVTRHPTAASMRTASRLVDGRAYDLYLRGRQAAAERRIGEAISLYEQALAADDGLAEAFAGLADALDLQQSLLGEADDAARRERRRETASRAYQLDPDLPQANVAMGRAAGSLADALGHLRRAIEIDPSFTEAYRQIGDEIGDVDPELAIRVYRRSLQIDPRFDAGRAGIALMLVTLNRWDEARRELDGASSSSGVLQGLRLLVDLDEHRFQPAAEALLTIPALRSAPPYWLAYVMALRTAGQSDDALREATQLVGAFPQLCNGRAILAGLRLEHGQMRPAHQLADPIVRAGRSEPGAADDVRCGATAAAAMGDARQLAAILERIASNETLLRHWTRAAFGQSGGALLRGRLYPWSGIADAPGVAPARRQLEQAYARARATAREKLAGVAGGTP